MLHYTVGYSLNVTTGIEPNSASADASRISHGASASQNCDAVAAQWSSRLLATVD